MLKSQTWSVLPCFSLMQAPGLDRHTLSLLLPIGIFFLLYPLKCPYFINLPHLHRSIAHGQCLKTLNLNFPVYRFGKATPPAIFSMQPSISWKFGLQVFSYFLCLGPQGLPLLSHKHNTVFKGYMSYLCSIYKCLIVKGLLYSLLSILQEM